MAINRARSSIGRASGVKPVEGETPDSAGSSPAAPIGLSTKDFIEMKTLKEYNDERIAHLKEFPEPHGLDIKCPECGEELWDDSLQNALLTFPPRVNVRCPKCNFRGSRIA